MDKKRDLKELEKQGAKLLIQDLLDDLKKFIDDKRNYKIKLKKHLFDSFIGEYNYVKIIFEYEGILEMRDQDEQEEFFEEKSNEIYNKFLNKHNEGLNLISIAKDGPFSALRNFNCKDIEDDISDAEKIGIASKVSAIWTAGGFMKNCIKKVKEPQATWKFVLGITFDIADIIVGIVLSLLCFGIWKFIRMTIPALKSLYYFYKAYKVNKTEPDNVIYYSRNLGKGVGFLVNIVTTAIKIRGNSSSLK